MELNELKEELLKKQVICKDEITERVKEQNQLAKDLVESVANYMYSNISDVCVDGGYAKTLTLDKGDYTYKVNLCACELSIWQGYNFIQTVLIEPEQLDVFELICNNVTDNLSRERLNSQVFELKKAVKNLD